MVFGVPFVLNFAGTEHPLQDGEGLLLFKLRIGKETFVVKCDKRSLENGLELAQLHINELSRQYGVLTEQVRGALCKLEALIGAAPMVGIWQQLLH